MASNIGLSHTLPRKPRKIVPNKIAKEGRRIRFNETGSFYVDHRSAGGDSPGIASTKAHFFGAFGEPPKTRFDDKITKTWGAWKGQRDYGMRTRNSEFLKQMYSTEQHRREHNEDQAKLLRRHRASLAVARGDELRRRPLKNRRRIAEQTKRRAFYKRKFDRSNLKSAEIRPTRHIRGAEQQSIPPRFTWHQSFAPSSTSHFSEPEMTAELLQRARRAPASRGRAVGYWNQQHLQLKLRSPNYTASGGSVHTSF